MENGKLRAQRLRFLALPPMPGGPILAAPRAMPAMPALPAPAAPRQPSAPSGVVAKMGLGGKGVDLLTLSKYIFCWKRWSYL